LGGVTRAGGKDIKILTKMKDMCKLNGMDWWKITKKSLAFVGNADKKYPTLPCINNHKQRENWLLDDYNRLDYGIDPVRTRA
jgi:hypothetical protein